VLDVLDGDLILVEFVIAPIALLDVLLLLLPQRGEEERARAIGSRSTSSESL